MGPRRAPLVNATGFASSCLIPVYGSGMRYRFRCTVARENAYTSGVGPGAGSVTSITRAPGTAAMSAADAKPLGGILGSGWPRGTGSAYVRPDTVKNRRLPSRDHLIRRPVP